MKVLFVEHDLIFLLADLEICETFARSFYLLIFHRTSIEHLVQ